MEIVILAVGRLKAGAENALCTDYIVRARKSGKALGFRSFELRELSQSQAVRAADRIVQEEAALIAALPKGGSTICLDAAGELVDSESFAAGLGREAAEAVPRATFVIGGPDGLGRELKARADRLISFGRVTWPHQIVRILLAEQLYRAMTILSRHPYHRA